MRTELTLNVKLLCHLYELGSNVMARSVYYKTALKKCVYFYSRLPRYCKPRHFKRMQVSVYTRYVVKNSIGTLSESWAIRICIPKMRKTCFQIIFQKSFLQKKMVISRGSGVKIQPLPNFYHT